MTAVKALLEGEDDCVKQLMERSTANIYHYIYVMLLRQFNS